MTPATGDAGDPITYKITLSGATTTDAFDATLEDTIPALIDSPTLFSVTDTAGIVTASNFNLTATPPFNLTTLIPFNMPVSATRQIVLTITGTAVVPSYYSYSVAGDGTLTTEVWETQNQTWLEFKRLLAAGETADETSAQSGSPFAGRPRGHLPPR